MNIRILITGGTFDKKYNEIDGDLYFDNTHVREMLDKGRCKVTIECRTLMMIDSLDMTTDDRYVIAENVAKAPEDHIVITHGTDSMVDTAKVIAQQVQDKVVVLTGAMRPFAFGSSDGMFNLGSAIAFVQILHPGVYIAMNGRYFQYNNVQKNNQSGIFEEIV